MTLQDILNKYGENHNIEGTKTMAFQELDLKEQIEFLQNAKGRDIVIVYPEDEKTIGGLDVGYSGEIDPNFNWENFVGTIICKNIKREYNNYVLGKSNLL